MTDTATWSAGPSAMTPVPYRVASRVAENRDSATLRLDPVREPLDAPQPGEFMMMYAFGIGEIAISVSGVPTVDDASITHTIRSVGAVSRALHDAQPDTVIGMRGPFGTSWGLAEATGRDLVIVAGGVGLAPLRPVVLGALAERDRFGRVTLIAGARSRDDFLFAEELRAGHRMDRWTCISPSMYRCRAGRVRSASSPSRCGAHRCGRTVPPPFCAALSR